MPTSTTVNNLKINKLTKAQYDDIQSPSETELYLVEESIDTTPTNGSDNPISSGAVYTALEGKEDVTPIVAQSSAVSTLTAEVGKYYRLDVAVETLAITLPTMTGVTNVKTITFYMTGGTTPGVTFTSAHDVHSADGFEIKSGETYEVNAAWNGLAWIVASVTINDTGSMYFSYKVGYNLSGYQIDENDQITSLTPVDLSTLNVATYKNMIASIVMEPDEDTKRYIVCTIKTNNGNTGVSSLDDFNGSSLADLYLAGFIDRYYIGNTAPTEPYINVYNLQPSYTELIFNSLIHG